MAIDKDLIIESIKTVYDPEIPVNIYDLGLIYGIDINDRNEIAITMTLTSPACPVAQSLPNQVRQTVIDATGVNEVSVDIVWDPPWNRDAMNDEARLALNLL
jgi:FeS assembly SUF system protein